MKKATDGKAAKENEEKIAREFVEESSLWLKKEFEKLRKHLSEV